MFQSVREYGFRSWFFGGVRAPFRDSQDCPPEIVFAVDMQLHAQVVNSQRSPRSIRQVENIFFRTNQHGSVCPDGLCFDRLHVSRSVSVMVRKKLMAHDLRSEEHTSELQSPMYLVCRLL